MIKAILDQLYGILGIITTGGPNAIIAILFVDIVVMAFANYFIVKFIVNFIKENSVSRDKILAEKDEVMKDRIAKTEALVAEYNRSQADVVDAVRKIETAVNQVKEIILVLHNRKT